MRRQRGWLGDLRYAPGRFDFALSSLELCSQLADARKGRLELHAEIVLGHLALAPAALKLRGHVALAALELRAGHVALAALELRAGHVASAPLRGLELCYGRLEALELCLELVPARLHSAQLRSVHLRGDAAPGPP